MNRKLAEHYEFIDNNNIGIWGWSYGGFAAGMALAMDHSDVLKCAASVAPVTDWTYYGKIIFRFVSRIRNIVAIIQLDVFVY